MSCEAKRQDGGMCRGDREERLRRQMQETQAQPDPMVQ